MGGIVQSPAIGNQVFNSQNWREIKTQNNQSANFKISYTQKHLNNHPVMQPLNHALKNLNRPKHLQNLLTGQQVYQYEVLLSDEDQYKETLSEFRFREENKKHVVAPKYIRTHERTQMCSTAYTIHIYVEYLPLRLEDISNITLQDFVYILEVALEGFQILERRYGAFEIDANLISINTQGIIKVWVNPDYSKNWPTISSANSHSRTPVFCMIRHLIQIVQEHVNWIPSPPTSKDISYNQSSISLEKNIFFYSFNSIQKFSSFLFRSYQSIPSALTFQETRFWLKQYSKSMKITVPKFLTSILRQIKAIKGIFDSEIMSSNQFDSKFQFKESSVFPVRVDMLGFYGGDQKGSIVHSQSNQTFADRLINGAQSRSGFTDRFSFRNKESSLFESLLINPKLMKSQEITNPKLPSPQIQQRDYNVPKSITPRPAQKQSFLGNYKTSRIEEEIQQSLFQSKVSKISLCSKKSQNGPQLYGSSSVSFISEAENKNSMKNLKKTTDDIITYSFQKKPTRITFTYNNSPTTKSEPLHFTSINDFEQIEEEKSFIKEELQNIKNQKENEDIRDCLSPYTQTYTTQKQELDLDPQILADLHKYSAQLIL